MVEGINTSQIGFNQPFRQQQSVQMTDEQKEQFQEIIANYNPENMTSEDMESLREAFESAGIAPSQELKTLMEEAGFAPPSGAGGQPPMGGMQRPHLQPNFMNDPVIGDFAEKVNSGDVSEEDLSELMDYIQSNFMEAKGNLVNSEV